MAVLVFEYMLTSRTLIISPCFVWHKKRDVKAHRVCSFEFSYLTLV